MSKSTEKEVSVLMKKRGKRKMIDDLEDYYHKELKKIKES